MVGKQFSEADCARRLFTDPDCVMDKKGVGNAARELEKTENQEAGGLPAACSGHCVVIVMFGVRGDEYA